jgi:SAM-dependent methyltransferase
MTQQVDFARYLEAKEALDARSIHPRLWAAFCERLSEVGQVLDIGCGLGATLDRLLTTDRLTPSTISRIRYTGIDRDAGLIEKAQTRFAERTGAVFEVAEFFDYARLSNHRNSWPTVTAHAFLDLFDLDAALDAVAGLLAPDGLAYLTLNFDDLTIIEPSIDPRLDEELLSAYHAAMYTQRWGGSGGERRAGRRLFHALTRRGFEVLDMAPSDWVIAPLHGAYRDDDKLVLEYLLAHIVSVVRQAGKLDAGKLEHLVAERERQIEAAELVYVAHQLDILAQRKPE